MTLSVNTKLKSCVDKSFRPSRLGAWWIFEREGDLIKEICLADPWQVRLSRVTGSMSGNHYIDRLDYGYLSDEEGRKIWDRLAAAVKK